MLEADVKQLIMSDERSEQFYKSLFTILLVGEKLEYLLLLFKSYKIERFINF